MDSTSTHQPDPIAHASPDQPPIDALLAEWKKCSPQNLLAPSVVDDIRFCRWPGQSADGRKHDKGDKTAFPWEGASDTRPMTVDRVITELVSMLTSSFWRAIVKPKASDDDVGAYAVSLADHFVTTRLYEPLIREVELAAQYCNHYGWYVLHPNWVQELGLKRRCVKLQELVMLGQQLAQQTGNVDLADLGRMILDPTLETQAIEALQMVYDVYARQQLGTTFDIDIPKLSASTLRRALVELRSQDAEADIVVPYVARNGPSVSALKPWDEIFVPADTTDLQSARVIVQREWLSQAELESRVRTHEYDPQWVKRAIKEKGKSSPLATLPEGTPGNAIRSMSDPSLPTGTTYSQGVQTNHDLIEVLHFTHRAVDDDGVPGIYLTTLHPLLTKDEHGKPIYAKHELVDYPHGEYPYVGGTREFVTRQFTASRGVPEIISTRQNEKKALLDAVIDRTSITVLPPVNVYPSPAGGAYRFGPAVQNKVQPGKEPAFMAMPSGTGMNEAFSTIDRFDREIDNQFGLLSPDVPPARSQMMQGNAVQRFLLTWSKALQQLVSLAQKYMPDAEFSDITGAPLGWLETRRDKPGLLAVELGFDVRELDSELVAKRIEAMNKAVLPSDVSGVINRPKWVELQVRAINPTWARELIQPTGAASQQIYDAVRNDIAQMFLGNEARYVKDDPTAQTKLQYATQIVQQNPNYQQALQAGGRFAELMQNYMKNLQFSITQEANKMNGAIGVKPVAQA